MKKLKEFSFYLVQITGAILIIVSFISLIRITITGARMNLDLSMIGFQNFLKLFSPFYSLFSATFIAITSCLAIENLIVLKDANVMINKSNMRIIWIQMIKEFLTDIEATSSDMAKEFKMTLHLIYDYLFESNFIISSKEETVAFFNKFFAGKIIAFEMQYENSEDTIYYPDETYSYSFEPFLYIICPMLAYKDCYSNFEKDLEEIYQIEVLKYSKFRIDPIKYEKQFEKK